MKRLIALISITAALATTGCVHKQTTKADAIRGAAYTGALVIVVGMAIAHAMEPRTTPTTAALPPQGAQP